MTHIQQKKHVHYTWTHSYKYWADMMTVVDLRCCHPTECMIQISGPDISGAVCHVWGSFGRDLLIALLLLCPPHVTQQHWPRLPLSKQSVPLIISLPLWYILYLRLPYFNNSIDKFAYFQKVTLIIRCQFRVKHIQSWMFVCDRSKMNVPFIFVSLTEEECVIFVLYYLYIKL